LNNVAGRVPSISRRRLQQRSAKHAHPHISLVILPPLAGTCAGTEWVYFVIITSAIDSRPRSLLDLLPRQRARDYSRRRHICSAQRCGSHPQCPRAC
jgi:hypothetical protein